MSGAGSARPPTSLWAIASLVTSALVCPPMCLIGLVLGVVGVVQTRPGRGYRGRRLAMAGIALGLAGCALTAVSMAWWHVNVRRPMIDGPRAALVAGDRGDVAAFAAAFRDTEADPAEAAAFLATLRERYGVFRAIEQDPRAAPTEPGAGFDTRRIVIPYRVHFERTSLRAEAEFVRTDDRGLPMVLRWGWLVVRDPVRGDLLYPPAASEPPSSPSPKSPEE